MEAPLTIYGERAIKMRKGITISKATTAYLTNSQKELFVGFAVKFGFLRSFELLYYIYQLIQNFMFYVIGLGNPGIEYEDSRHNTGKMAVEFFLLKK